jgi:hypothetical protein
MTRQAASLIVTRRRRASASRRLISRERSRSSARRCRVQDLVTLVTASSRASASAVLLITIADFPRSV